MTKVVLDTNVMVSGIFWTGTPSKIIHLWLEDNFEIMITVEILAEYTRIMKELNKKYKLDIVDQILEKILDHADMIHAPRFPSQQCEDPDDDRLLECAYHGKADFLVSGDKLLLKMNPFHKVKILTPGEFYKIF